MWCLKKAEGRQGRRSGCRERRGEGAEEDAEVAPLRAHAGKIRRNSVGPAPRRFPVKAQALKQKLGQTLI